MSNQLVVTLVLQMLGLCALPGAAPAQIPARAAPKPQFQGDFFSEMPRVFCTVQRVDARRRTLTIRPDGGGDVREVPIRDDTELHFRDSWGELTDYFPGQHVMLFLYIDDNKNWTYPRAVQDEIHVSARHGWFARVTKIDREQRLVYTERLEKNEKVEAGRTIRKTFAYLPDVRVWKGDVAGSIETLRPGDEVIQQLVDRNGVLAATEILDRKGDDAVRAAQEIRHRADQDRLGLPAYVNDLDPISGSVVISVAWSGAERAKTLKAGSAVALVPADGTPPFAAYVGDIRSVDTRARIQLVANARAVSRLAYGQSLRLFVPGTGPALPTGRAGLPKLP